MIGRLLLAGICAIGLASTASAQLSSSASGFSSAPTVANQAEYWDMMSQLGNCLAQQKTEQSRAFVGSAIGSDAESAAFKSLFHRRYNNCMGNFVNASMLRAHVRGLVAEGLFENLPDATTDRLVADRPSSPAPVVTFHDFARCFVTAHPEEARDLLRRTRVATKGEQQFVGSLVEKFGPCLPADKTFTLRPTTVRMAVAEALYRAATGQSAPVMQGTN
jgi:hypothetical protein